MGAVINDAFESGDPFLIELIEKHCMD